MRYREALKPIGCEPYETRKETAMESRHVWGAHCTSSLRERES